ncbi:MAG: hypothetical protein KAW88_08240 [Candidatus Cloacimonetes bacterium]|nr:hypothetical protein [Candidatus Cloacimonadota bacterium]
MAHVQNLNLYSYLQLLQNLNTNDKLKLISYITESIINKKKEKNKTSLLDCYGQFLSEKDADTIIQEIYESRKFSNRDIKL